MVFKKLFMFIFYFLFELKILKLYQKSNSMKEILEKGSPFIGEKIQLRALEKSDLEEIMKNWNTYETRLFLGNIIPMSSMMEEDWINSVHQRRKNMKAFIFAIDDKETKKFLGTCGLEDIYWTSRSAVLGIAIHNPENTDKGYGTDTMKCLLKFGFNVLNLNRIELWLMEYNKRALHVYEKVGFKEVGRKRQGHFIQGSYHDIIVMDIIKSEFSELYNKK